MMEDIENANSNITTESPNDGENRFSTSTVDSDTVPSSSSSGNPQEFASDDLIQTGTLLSAEQDSSHNQKNNNTKEKPKVSDKLEQLALMPLSVNQLASYHPSFMYCGDCTTCAPPPRKSKSRSRNKHKHKYGPPRASPTVGIPNNAEGDDDSSSRMSIMESGYCGEEPDCVENKGGASVNVDVFFHDRDDESTGGIGPADSSTVSSSGLGDAIEMTEYNKKNSDNRYDDKLSSGHNRTSLYILNLNCPSQILVIKSIVQPMPGVTKVIVPQVSDQMVHVDHDPFLTPASLIMHALRTNGYDAQIRQDGGRSLSDKQNPSGLCKSQIFLKKLTNAADVPVIHAMLEPLPGVIQLATNISTQVCFIDHDPFQTPVSHMVQLLNDKKLVGSVAKFDAVVKHDGGGIATRKPRVGRSRFFIKSGLCCMSEVPAIHKIIDALPGHVKTSINITNKIVYVDHDVHQTTASVIAEALSGRGSPFTAVIQRDAGVEFALQSPHSSDYVESILFLGGLSSAMQSQIEDLLERRFGKTGAEIRVCTFHIPSRTIKIEHNPNLVPAVVIAELLMENVDGLKEGDVVVSTDGASEGRALPLVGEDGKKVVIEGNTLHVNVILSGICWVVSMLSVLDENWKHLEYVGILSLLFGLPPVAIKAFQTLKRCQFDANCMMVIAAIGAAALGEFDEAASVAFLFSISEWLESRATLRARRALGSIVNLRPDRANLIDPSSIQSTTPSQDTTPITTNRNKNNSGSDDDTKSIKTEGFYNGTSIIVVPASSVMVNSLVSVRTGDKVPTDGVIVEGFSTVDESSLTGEARPIPKHTGDTICGGSINVGPTQLIIRTTSTVDDSAVSRLIRLVEESQANRSPTEKLVDSFAKRYTPIVLGIAVLMCTVPWYFGTDVGRQWVYNGLIIIVLACPCALTISTPVTYAAGLAATAQRGVIIKGGARLEALGRVRKMVFDKTGTLTEGRFALAHLQSVAEEQYSSNFVTMLLALMEASSNHPLSATLVNAAKLANVAVPSDAQVEEHTVLEGEGITAIVSNISDSSNIWKNNQVNRVYVGNQRLFTRLGMYSNLPVNVKVAVEQWSHQGGTVGFIGIENVGIIGAFSVVDSVRQESKEVLQILANEYGMEITMLTGDSNGAASAVGNQLGLHRDCIKSQLLPEDKLHIVASMMEAGVGTSTASLCNPRGKRGLILMCGDGVNDAPAMAAADVGVAMGNGAALAMEMSDVTLMDSNLNKLLFSIKMGRKVILTIKENIIFSLLAKLVVVGLTFAGKTTLLSAIVTDVGVMLIVTLNGMRLLPRKRKEFADADELNKECLDAAHAPKKGATRKRPRKNPRSVRYEELPLDGTSTAIPEIV